MKRRLSGAVLAVLCLAECATAGQARSLPPVVLDVPFVSQTPELCGGAAAAMVLRYWGRRDVFPGDFARLVDRQQGGIPAERLAADLEARGFDTHVFAGDEESVVHHLARGRPLVLLLEVARGVRHYVVVVAWTADRVLFHDPAGRPFQVLSRPALEREWAATGHLALLTLPSSLAARAADTPNGGGPPAPAPTLPVPDTCGGLVPAAVALARSDDLAGAEQRLQAAAKLCPWLAAPLRELAGVRFLEKRYPEAARLAREATALDAGDAAAWSLLATSRFLAGGEEEALRAWNHVDQPLVDLVSVEGLDRTRPAVVSSRLGIAPRTLLTPRRWRLATRRLEEMPTLSAARLRYEPLGSGRVDVVAAVVERPLLPSLRSLVLAAGVDAATSRTTRLTLASVGHEGGALEAGVRWWEHRPAAWLSFEAPGALHLPGLVSLEALYDEQRYAVPGTGGSSPIVERRRRGTLATRHWLTSGLRAGVSLSIERDERPETRGLIGLQLEQRLLGDRLALRGGIEGAAALGDGRSFAATEMRAAARTSGEGGRSRFLLEARLGLSSVGVGAPLAYWPGAGTGVGRPILLRAHPLLSRGVVTGEAFGRRLLDGGVELQRRLCRLGPIAVRLAAFADSARAWDRPGRPGPGPWLVDLGVGVRLRPATVGALRLDVARPVDGGPITVSAGWEPPWPR